MYEVVLQKIMPVTSFALGTALGSFINVVVHRWPAGESIVSPGSRCPSCKTPIRWYDNIPILSYILLGAKCRHCKTGISIRYPAIELMVGLLVLGCWVRFGLHWNFLVWGVMSCVLVTITFLDLDHWWIPDLLTYPSMVFLLAASFLPGRLGWFPALVGLGPALLMLVVAWIFERVTGREGLGLGDVKLIAVLGLASGLMPSMVMLMWAALQASVVGGILIAVGATHGNTQENNHTTDGDAHASDTDEDDWTPHPRAIPFGPFLVLGAFEVVFFPHLFVRAPLDWLDTVARLLL